MKFFVPAATDDAQAEQVYRSIAQFNNCPIRNDRIWKLRWMHNGTEYECEVGKPLPAYFRTRDEPVLVILEQSNCFMICTQSRGGVSGQPILAGLGIDTWPIYFSREVPPGAA